MDDRNLMNKTDEALKKAGIDLEEASIWLKKASGLGIKIDQKYLYAAYGNQAN